MRYVDWQKRFWAALEGQRSLPFKYGSCDCILFAATVADAISADGNYVLRAREAFNWNNRETAYSLLATDNLQALIESVLGAMQPWPRLVAGDLVLCTAQTAEPDEPPQILCVHDGTSPIAKAHRKLVTVAWSHAIGGWRIA